MEPFKAPLIKTEWIKPGPRAENSFKAAFFNAQADEPWAAEEYTAEETEKIRHVIDTLPPLKDCIILEPGCGTGRLTEILSEHAGPGGRILSFDISSRMIAKAWERLEGYSNVELACAPLEWVDLPSDSVDIIFCHQVFPHFDRREQALSLMSGWLKPSGLLAVFHLISIEQINDLHRKSGTAVAGDIMPEKRELEEMLVHAGLEIEFFDDQSDRYLLIAGHRKR